MTSANFQPVGYAYYIKKYRYYRSWYESLGKEEKVSVIGLWIFENCIRYHQILGEIESLAGSHQPGPINYN